MLLVTTPTVDGATVSRYHGLVSAEAANGINVIRDFFARMRDFFGGRVASTEAVVRDTRSQALEALSIKAEAAGANAVIGIVIDAEMTREGALLFMVTGNAVTLVPAS